MGKVALGNSIILIKRDPQIALCQVEIAFSEQLGQKWKKREGAITFYCPELSLTLVQVHILTSKYSSKSPWDSLC